MELRDELHAAVDEIVDRFAAITAPTASPHAVEPQVVVGEPIGTWDFRWPDGSIERFDAGREYELRDGEGTVKARLAWTTRWAWGRDRRRGVVFIEVGREGSRSHYPAAEFVQTDAGDFASTIPNPKRPRSLLSDGQEVPDRYRDAVVRRADEVFPHIKRGPSLRLVVGADDEIGILRHGHWVATARGRIRRSSPTGARSA